LGVSKRDCAAAAAARHRGIAASRHRGIAEIVAARIRKRMVLLEKIELVWQANLSMENSGL